MKELFINKTIRYNYLSKTRIFSNLLQYECCNKFANPPIENIILFEIFKYWRNTNFFLSFQKISGEVILKEIIHIICSESDLLNNDSSTEEYFYEKINDLLDDYAIGRLNSQLIDFLEKYQKYLQSNLNEYNDSFADYKKRCSFFHKLI